MKLSRFGQGMGTQAGIARLMEDLGSALGENRDMLMLGGGNPGHIPAVQAQFRRQLQRLTDSDAQFDALVGNYGPPKGSPRFRDHLAGLLKSRFGWDIGREHIAITNGSQSASFMLLNMFGGHYEDGSHRPILLPLTPEYIGYTDQGLTPGFFVAAKPTIEELEEGLFKYRVDFDALDPGQKYGALCVSRPTNPTGNVLTDREMGRLAQLAIELQVPLIVDSAYGTPFPDIIFSDVTPVWGPHLNRSAGGNQCGHQPEHRRLWHDTDRRTGAKRRTHPPEP